MSIQEKIDRLIAEYEEENPLCEASCILLDLLSYEELKAEIYPDDDVVELEVLTYQGLKVGMNNFTHTVIHVS